ncbi:MAG: acetyl-CoA C-acetyltransferase [Planctomycetota bacterium]
MTRTINDIVVLAGARTGMAEYTGHFSRLSAIDLGVVASKAALERAKVKGDEVDHVIFGNALQTSADAIYGARHVGLKSGVRQDCPAVTVNRLCGSGIESLVQGAQNIMLGEADVVLAGGMENMTQAPHVIRGARAGFRLGQAPMEDLLMASLLDPHCGLFMAQTAQEVARRHAISRKEQDEYALRSHRLGADAVKQGRFADEIVPVTIKQGKKTYEFATDDHIKPDTTLEGLSALPAAFPDKAGEGSVTAGNASGIVDGAAAVVLTTLDNASKRGQAPLGRLVSWHRVGVEPAVMGLGPVPAIEGALAKAKLSLSQIDLIEINEAFAAQYLGCEKLLKLDREKCNVNGGAIAIGHPLAATGTRIVLSVLLELRRRGKRYGVASACIGGGQGIALVVEALK